MAIKYLKILWLFFRINYLRAMEYRLNFFTAFLPAFFYSVGYLVFMGAILSRVPSVSGWDLDKMLLLFAVSQFVHYTQWIFYRVSLERFSESIRDGSFDSIAKLPINPRFVSSFRVQSPSAIIPFQFSVALFFYSIRNISIGPLDTILFLILLFCGFFIYYNISFALISLAFFIVDADDLLWFADDITRFGSYPLEIYPAAAQFILTFVIPVMLLVYVPTTALMGMVNWTMVIATMVMTVVTWLVSQKIWQLGLKHYSSASS